MVHPRHTQNAGWDNPGSAGAGLPPPDIQRTPSAIARQSGCDSFRDMESMLNEQLVMGTLIALLSLFGLTQERWLLTKTAKGRTLMHLCGENRGPWVFRAMLVACATFGTLLALDIIRPLQW